MRMTLALVVCASALIAAAPAAGATAWSKEAVWEVTSLQGSFSSERQLTNTQCPRTDAEGNTTYVTLTGSSLYSIEFKSVRRGRLYVAQRHNERAPMITGSSTAREMLGEFTFDLGSTMDSSEEPAGCRPDRDQEPKDCGPRTARYGLLAGANNSRRWKGLAMWLAPPKTGYDSQPNMNLWKNCVPADAGGSLPMFNYSGADVVAGQTNPKTLMSRKRTAVVKASKTWTTRRGGSSEGFEATGTHKFSWTMRLKRVSGKQQVCGRSGCRTSRY